MMAYRSVLSVPATSDPPLNIDYFNNARELGINPEVWKLARAIEKRFGSISLPSGAGGSGALTPRLSPKRVRLALPFNFHNAAHAAWRTCEYTLPMRLLLRWRGEEA